MEGSSIEEAEHDRAEQHEEEQGGVDTEEAPAYTNAGLSAPIEVGPNGYAVGPCRSLVQDSADETG